MPQMVPAVLKDTLDENIDHTFKPQGEKDGIVTLVENTGIPMGNRRITLGRTVTAQGRHKTTLKFVYPVIQNATVNGVSVPTVVRTAYCNVEISVDGSSSAAERGEISLAFHELAKGNWNAFLRQYLVDLEGLY